MGNNKKQETKATSRWLQLPGPPKEPKIMAQYPKIESRGSIGSIILGPLEVQVALRVSLWVGVVLGLMIVAKAQLGG